MMKQALDNSKFKRNLLDENQAYNEKLCEKIDALEEKLNLILARIEKVENGTSKMETHIDFINTIYLRVRNPLFWICDRVNYMRGYSGLDNQKTYTSYLRNAGLNRNTDINEQD